jgi:hypothetical protein
LENLSLETLEEIKNSALAYIDQGDALIDGEAEIDKLLMMHMSKHHHDDEVPSLSGHEASANASYADMNPPLRKESSRKKRSTKPRVMTLALDKLQNADISEVDI